jgi:hypothetical protein
MFGEAEIILTLLDDRGSITTGLDAKFNLVIIPEYCDK